MGTKFLEWLNTKFKLNKPNHGIAYATDVAFVCGSVNLSCSGFNNIGGEDKSMYQSIYTIVDKGRGEAVVEAATKAGAGGATIVGARGSGIHETGRLFNMDIEPEKEVVIIILKSEIAERVVSSIRDELDMINRETALFLFRIYFRFTV